MWRERPGDLMDDGFKRDVSEFNSSVAYLNRINYYLAMCAEAKEEKNPSAWLDYLIIIFSELSTEMEAKEKENFFSQIATFNKRIFGLDPTQRMMPFDLFSDMLNFELELRRINKESGLQQRVMDEGLDSI